jgi:hypothetical protein
MSTSSANPHCLIVALQEELTLVENVPWPFQGFRLGDNIYRDVGLGEWTGFYDWMRRANGDLVGVRYSPLVDNQLLFEAARALRYARIDSTGGLEVYFSDDDGADERQSCDQEFQYDPVFRSELGGWAIAFDVVALTPMDQGQLRRIGRNWATVATF